MSFDNKPLPKVLVCCTLTWQKSGSQHTLPEIFSCWDKEKVSQVYTKVGLPDTDACSKFFRINENAVIKSIFNRKVQTSSVVEAAKGQESSEELAEQNKEKHRYRNAAKSRNWLLVICREFVWKLGKWKTKELDEFLDEAAPDILFMPIYSVVYMSRLQRYIIKKTKKPVVCFLTDDTYSYKSCGGHLPALVHRVWNRQGVKFLVKNCKKLFVMTPMAKEEFDRIFNINSVLLTKPIDFSGIEFKEITPAKPLKMIYTGNLAIGRDKALAKIAEAIANINKDGERITLDIYSADTPEDRVLKVLNSGGSHFKGVIEREEVLKVQSEADIVVFAESMAKKYRETARLSFSTKLTDYFASGKCIFALGSKSIAPVDYLIKEDAAVVSTDYKEIEGKLRMLCDNPALVSEYGRKAYGCGVRNHHIEKVLGDFKENMLDVMKD